jgi:hypothetical protein
MKAEHIQLSLKAVWRRPKAQRGEPYVWGFRTSSRIDPAWSKRHLIYRWVRTSNDRVAVVGEAKRPLGRRVNNYQTGTDATNKRVRGYQQKLESKGDSLYLEYLVRLKGFNLKSKHQRRWAEGLLAAFYRPNCRETSE